MRLKKARVVGVLHDPIPNYYRDSERIEVKEDYSKEPDFYDQVIRNEYGKKEFAKFVRKNLEFRRKIEDELGIGYVFAVPLDRTYTWLDDKEDYAKYVEDFRTFFRGKVRNNLMLSEDFVHRYDLLSSKKAFKKYCCYCGSLKS